MRWLLLLAVSSLVGCGSAPSKPAEPTCPCEAPPPAAPPESAAASPCTEGYPYTLPSAGDMPPPVPIDGAPGAQASPLVVDIDATGGVRVDGKPLDAAALRQAAATRREKEPDVRAIIRADRATPWSGVVQVMDAIKQGGVAKLAFAVTTQ